METRVSILLLTGGATLPVSGNPQMARRIPLGRPAGFCALARHFVATALRLDGGGRYFNTDSDAYRSPQHLPVSTRGPVPPSDTGRGGPDLRYGDGFGWAGVRQTVRQALAAATASGRTAGTRSGRVNWRAFQPQGQALRVTSDSGKGQGHIGGRGAIDHEGGAVATHATGASERRPDSTETFFCHSCQARIPELITELVAPFAP